MNNLIIVLAFVLYSVMHPIHLTVTNVEHKEAENKVEFSIRIFVDDFETILQNINNDSGIKLLKKYINSTTELYIEKYVKSHLSFVINEQLIKNKKIRFTAIKFTGEGTETAIWSYFEFRYSKKIRNLKIRNSLMIDLYKDQQNLLIFTCGKFQKGLEFSNNDTLKSLKIY